MQNTIFFLELEFKSDNYIVKSIEPLYFRNYTNYIQNNIEFFSQTIPGIDIFTNNDDRVLDLLWNEYDMMSESRYLHLLVFDKADTALERILGDISVYNISGEYLHSCHLGCKTDANFANKGIMSEILPIVLDFLFRDLMIHRIEANVLPFNKAAVRLVEKIGFEYEGIAKHYLYINGEWRNHLRYSLIDIR